ncbi:DUF4893 domain-containing protein [Limoniibacter endophyticus]|uniref:DUF4893 domain-containing protein n=1 Tax=Limoniibacter endophyticus TaxID=1565040 RepID=A0A8J3DTN5_9HYPH|nr:DUF4893 domain-containing protein [Limoniibacter endophyticus]GHC75488.1 DUF4893 domain-containing protein [Limoniibacter endophyticus]
MKKFLAAALLLLVPPPAHADGSVTRIMTDSDKARLAAYEQTREDALARANTGNATQLQIAKAVLNTPRQPLEGFDMAGNWQCRTIKFGGPAELVVYNWFRCRVTDDGAGWMLEKISGSQRTKGMFFDDGNDRMIYLGTGFVTGERAPAYGKGAPADQVGYAYSLGKDRFRIEFPAPHLESKFDVLELKR